VQTLPAILTLLTGIAGWFYLFYSRAAQGLAGLEHSDLNRRRSRLRRAGGGAMLLLSIALALGFYAIDRDRPALFLAVWGAVLVLLAAVMVLAMIDVRLTLKLRNRLLALRDSHRGPDADRSSR
jgi:peptidoglycan/LPS O-acetylase OafA/YrhL